MYLSERYFHLKSRLSLLVEEREDDPVEALLFWISERTDLTHRQPITQRMMDFLEPISKLRYEATTNGQQYQSKYHVQEKIIDAFYSLFLVTLIARTSDNSQHASTILAFRYDRHGRVDQCLNVIEGAFA